jgi:hypothetical protein
VGAWWLFVLLAPQAHAQNWTPLFDGKTLSGWRVLGGQSKFEVRDGILTGTSAPNSEHTFLVTEHSYGDFILEYEFLVDSEMNSGVQIRSHSDPAYQGGKVFGLQVEIDGDLRTRRFWTGGIFDQTRRGWLADLAQNEPARNAFKPGEWNHTRVVALGDSIRTWINGVPAADLVDSADLEGFIALQVHQNRSPTPVHVAFRNLRLQDFGQSGWRRMRPDQQPAGDFTLRYSPRLSETLQFRGLRLTGAGVLSGATGVVLARPTPQPGVKPLASDGAKRMTVSLHEGRLVIHSDGVRIIDIRRAIRPEGPIVFSGRVELLTTPDGSP